MRIIAGVLCLVILSTQIFVQVDGKEIEPNSIPYQAFLNITGSDKSAWVCAGSLIKTNYVLTAGRCCDGASSIEITLGAHNITAKEATQVKQQSNICKIHPELDIALIALQNPVTLTDAIQTVQLPNKYERNTYDNGIGRVSAWGLMDAHNLPSYSQVLVSQENRIISNSDCESTYYGLSNYDICMQTNSETSSCKTDYGAPLTVNNVQVGVASQDVADCVSGYPSVFTRVSEFLDWIMVETDDGDDNSTTTIDTSNSTSSENTSSPTSSSGTSSPTSSENTSSPTSSSGTSSPTSSENTSSPTSSSDTSSPTSSSDTSNPTSSSDTSSPTPSGDTSNPTPSGDTSKPTPSGDTSKPTSSADTTTAGSSVPDSTTNIIKTTPGKASYLYPTWISHLITFMLLNLMFIYHIFT